MFLMSRCFFLVSDFVWLRMSCKTHFYFIVNLFQVNRIYEAASDGDQILWLYVLQRGFSASQGALNAFAYGFTPGVREAIFAELALWCPCLRALHSSGPSSLSRTDSPSEVQGRIKNSSFGQGGTTFAAAHAVPPPDFSRMQSIGGGSLDESEFEGAIAMSVLAGKVSNPSSGEIVANPFRVAVEKRSQMPNN
jgi:hypothetical protein